MNSGNQQVAQRRNDLISPECKIFRHRRDAVERHPCPALVGVQIALRGFRGDPPRNLGSAAYVKHRGVHTADTLTTNEGMERVVEFSAVG
jgi:hypothetical protein